MKKLALALSAIMAFAGSAIAADIPARSYLKAPALPERVVSWTGCYVGGGGGYGLWNQENTTYFDGLPRVQITGTVTAGGRGYFGTVQGGCDYQFAALGTGFVAGAFGDYDFSSLKGKHVPPAFNSLAEEKMSSAWAVGGRVGWLVTPSLLTYFVGGYTEATFDRQNLTNLFGPPFGIATGRFIDKRTYKGWFLGAGDEYALSVLPGLFWKTEYRFSEFDVATNPIRDTGLPIGISEDSKKYVHSVRSELVYRFNSGGPAAADLSARTYSKAPPPAASVVNWTGCYVGGGGGYGLWNQENTLYDDTFAPRLRITETATTGGRGYFGTVQGGCDYQFAALGTNFVVGAFGDYDFSSLKGKHVPTGFGIVADEKMSSAWAGGGRVGWLVTPSLLTYFVGGYTEATFDRQNYALNSPPFGVASAFYADQRTYKGWFLGAGDEYALSLLPGLFWKTEYRFSDFDVATNPIRFTATGVPTGNSEDSKKYAHTVRSELVYRFNWGGAPVAARY